MHSRKRQRHWLPHGGWLSAFLLAVTASSQPRHESPPPTGGRSDDTTGIMNQSFDPQRLHGRWTHSHEEDSGDRVVYRTSEYPFPPSRGRDAFTLAADGTARVHHPGPVDRGETATGTWTLDGDTLTIGAGDWSARFVIESVDDSTLVMRRR